MLKATPARLVTAVGAVQIGMLAAHPKGGLSAVDKLQIANNARGWAQVIAAGALGSKGIHVPVAGHSGVIESVAAAGSGGGSPAHAQLMDYVQPAAAEQAPHPVDIAASSSGASSAVLHNAPTSGSSVQQLNPEEIYRQWAQAADPSHPRAAGSPETALRFDPREGGGMTIDLKNATAGTVLPDGKPLTAAELQDARVLVTVDVAGNGGHATERVLEVTAPGGSRVVSRGAAELLEEGYFKTVEVAIPEGGGSDESIDILSTAVGTNPHHVLTGAEATTLVNGLEKRSNGQGAAGAVPPEAPSTGVKPPVQYELTFTSIGHDTVQAEVSSPSILTPEGENYIAASFKATLPSDLGILTTPKPYDIPFWNVTEGQFEQDIARLQQALGAEGLRAEIVNAKGQVLNLEEVRRQSLKTILQQGDRVVAVPIGDKLSLSNLVAPNGWKVDMNFQGATLSFTAPNSGKLITVHVPPTAIKNGSIEFDELKQPITDKFREAGYDVSFSNGFKMHVSPLPPARQGTVPPPSQKPYGAEAGGWDPTGAGELAVEIGIPAVALGATAAALRARRKGNKRSIRRPAPGGSGGRARTKA
jgi:hypothetical protein